MKQDIAAEIRDRETLSSARHLIKELDGGRIPPGENKATLSEFLSVHAAGLEAMKQRRGKSEALLTIGRLRKQFTP